MNILVTGANGQLGSEIKKLSSDYSKHIFFFTDAKDLDITKKEVLSEYFKKNEINLCLNCAAYTGVDKAEEDLDLAYLINATGVKNLAESCFENDAILVHISTDYVFDGKGFRPYLETDSVEPVNKYGETKLEGEKFATEANPKTFIFRTSWLYSSYGNNFVKTMLKLGEERDSLNIIFDQIGTPTFAGDLAEAILKITLDQNSKKYGIYHFSNEGVASWYDFTKAIFELSDINCKVNPINTEDYPTPAKRPNYSVFDKKKFKQNFGLEIPYWRDSLKKVITLLEK
jgi:dTDP-4-dehydrorhamnose reductase